MKITGLFFSILFLLSCQEKEDRISGPVVEVMSQAGEYFEDSPFLPSLLAHGILLNEDYDTLNVFVLSRHTGFSKMEIVPLGAFKILEDTLTTQFILAYPYDSSFISMPKMSYNDFVIRNNAAKVLIDSYFSNYKGLGKTRVVNWQNTHIAQKIVDDFIGKKNDHE